MMSHEERATWVYLVVVTVVYLAYVGIVIAQAAGGPITEVDYVGVLLWSLVASIIANILIQIIVEIARPDRGQRRDVRDRQIEHLSVVRTWWFVIGGAIAALLLAMAEAPYFWIANAIYLGFVLQAVGGSVVKLVAYRRGF